MNAERIRHILGLLREVEFADPMPYTFAVIPEKESLFIQGTYYDADTYTGHQAKQYTRRWFIADDATDSQIVQTVFKACLTSAEHRVREAFAYKGVRVYGPHYDVEDLVKLGKERQWKGAPKKDYRG